jgi:two-component system, OmpR family, response regulator
VARILVVDDNDDVRQLVGSVLAAEGYKVTQASNGEKAMQSMNAQPPDLVVLDVMMPEVDGYSVLKRMVEEGFKKKTRVLLLTAKTSEQDWIRGYRLGADRYLTKPFTMEELLRTITDMFRMTIEQLRKEREKEIEKARLFSKLENAFGEL